MLLDGRGVVFSAVDALLYPSFTLGADGAIAALLAACPGLCVSLWEAVEEDDHDTALALHQRLLRIWNAIEAPNLPANVKTAMEMQGRKGGVSRAPMPASSTQQREAIRIALQEADVSLL
jgi:4-hydroxy-tetrahydrodipicolinate synthase